MIRSLVSLAVRRAVELAARTRAGRFCLDQSLTTLMGSTCSVLHSGTKLVFSVPNRLTKSRIDTFASKEPETLEWIDSIPRGSVVWDVGANIGLYTCYAAKARECTVFAFEPSVFNLELLARNIALNGLGTRATIIPLPLSDGCAISALNMSTTEWGGAMSTFDKDYTHDGKALEKVFDFRTIGLSMDDAMRLLKVPAPDYIKMDVDGIEHLILKGGPTVLSRVKGILIEINDVFEKQATDSPRYLTSAGLRLREKRHGDIIRGTSLESSYNQVWDRMK